MPIVFGGAVSVNAIFAWTQLRKNPDAHISPALWVGMALVVVGVILVAKHTPHGAPSKPSQPDASTQADNDSGGDPPTESEG